MNRTTENRITVISAADAPEDMTEGFTKRVLLSLVVDVTELRETAERLQVQVFTLARVHGIKPPKSE